MKEELELTQGINWEQEENLEEIEIDDLELSDQEEEQEDDEEEEVEPVNRKTAPKLLAERKKLKTENSTLKQRLSELEFKAEVNDLKAKYWEINVDSFKEFRTKSEYMNLPLEDAIVLFKNKQPKEERPSNIGIVGSKWTPTQKYITMASLSTLSQSQYDKARQLIDEWKLFLK